MRIQEETDCEELAAMIVGANTARELHLANRRPGRAGVWFQSEARARGTQERVFQSLSEGRTRLMSQLGDSRAGGVSLCEGRPAF